MSKSPVIYSHGGFAFDPANYYTKTEVDTKLIGLLDYKGGYNANTDTPDLTSGPNAHLKGDAYTVTDPGTFFGEAVESGDFLFAEKDNPIVLADWTIVNMNISKTIEVSYPFGKASCTGTGQYFKGAGNHFMSSTLGLVASAAGRVTEISWSRTNNDSPATIDIVKNGSILVSASLGSALKGSEIFTSGNTFVVGDVLSVKNSGAPSLDIVNALGYIKVEYSV